MTRAWDQTRVLVEEDADDRTSPEVKERLRATTTPVDVPYRVVLRRYRAVPKP